MKWAVLWVDSCWGIKDLGTNPSGGASGPDNEQQLEATILAPIWQLICSLVVPWPRIM